MFEKYDIIIFTLQSSQDTLRLSIVGNKEVIENPKTAWRHSLVTSFPCKNIFLALALKIYAQKDIKVFFLFCLTLLGFFNFLKISCTGLYVLQSFHEQFFGVQRLILALNYSKGDEFLNFVWNTVPFSRSSKTDVSFPYLTVWKLCDLNVVLFLSKTDCQLFKKYLS